jgi:hypothetical protein
LVRALEEHYVVPVEEMATWRGPYWLLSRFTNALKADAKSVNGKKKRWVVH